MTAAEVKGIERHVFVSPRTGTSPGVGTQDNPFNVRTEAQFDNLMRRLPENVHVHLYPGCRTNGWHSGEFDALKKWSPKNGWEISGVGKGVHLTLVNNNWPGGASAIGTEYNAHADYCQIHDLTIDCNHEGQPSTNCSLAICIQGNHTRVQRVRAINFGTTTPIECFVIALQAGHPDFGSRCDQRIEDCIIENPSPSTAGGGITAMMVWGIGVGGTIKSNWVEGEKINCGALATLDGSEIIGNHFERVGAGVYHDTGNMPWLRILGNTFNQTLRGVRFDLHDRGYPFVVGELQVENNEFNLRDGVLDATGVDLLGHYLAKYGTPGQRYGVGGQPDFPQKTGQTIPYCFKNVLLRSNNFRTGQGQIAVAIHNCEMLRMENNLRRIPANTNKAVQASVVGTVVGEVVDW